MSDVEQRIEQWLAALNGSDLLSHSDVIELEAHLREEMEHLRSAGLSDEEAFFVSRRRLGDTAALETEYAKLSPHRRLVGGLSWMAAGVLSYMLISHVSSFVTQVSTVLAYAVGLRDLPLTLLACIARMLAFVGVGAIAWRFVASRSPSQPAGNRVSPVVRMGLFAACIIVVMGWIAQLSQYLLVRMLGMSGMVEIAKAQVWVSVGWSLLMPFLFAGLIFVVAMRNRRHMAAE